ncbi:hypothetical protein [Paraconexibacter algicola]|uniref:Uncharacterized protein n=1 Tax=Paraconexibacter algicola TaxID=2133960 RepID=A0A2T4UE01_9ACTN|nr:hypothetical protein [Paraconexibacter algicola]PTL55736.1 hypothetical protein C7Y72_19090 [Paraconexibacter algicola]
MTDRRCKADRFPPQVIDAMVRYAAEPVDDDGHTDCYYAGMLDAALRVMAEPHPDEVAAMLDPLGIELPSASTEDGGVTGVQAPAGRSRAARMAAEFNTHPNSLGPAHVRALAATLMGEESQELLVELTGDEADRSKIARELADVTYVAYTIAWSYGIDLDAALREIHRAAMDKIHANVRREGDGKIIKPPGFVPPDMTRAVERGLSSTEDRGDDA